ncbi:MAG: amino acid adenylation domain-containing protein, partial [Micropruina sp.]|uniref:amino acid adenylation domain-containing protein n=1 Tax=Micropruina sp. TaxID=2737536 RepID=UPI0039E36EDE
PGPGARGAAEAGRDVRGRLQAAWRRVLGSDAVDPEASFFDQGGNSLSLMRLQVALREEFGCEIPITQLLRYPSIASQQRLVTGDDRAEAAGAAPRPGALDVAIIGIGIRVPGAADAREFWANLRRGDESISFYDDEQLRALGIAESTLRDPDYVKAGGHLGGVDGFDTALFRIPPAEAEATSPQLRLLYECFWQACEDAGYDPTALPGRVGVFAGGSDDFEWYRHKLLDRAGFGDAYQNFTLATNHFLSTRLSYQFDLTGPALSALAGCSTSLLTIHLAARSLQAGECELAVAGGVTFESPNSGGYRYVEGMMLSPDGHCRPFDAEAGGTVFSNGAALMLLKPLDAALRDGDPVYAVIAGSAIGNDGRRKLSFTSPSEDGQYDVIRAAYESSGIDPGTVSFVEGHGTGTLLGDPVEVASLTRAFPGAPAGSVLLGSVKGNVGHTDSAAGAVGLAKVALSLAHRYLPGTRNYARPNPNIDFGATPFTVSADGRAWVGERLRAGINSFGVGGTNVHLIVESAPPRDPGAHVQDEFELLQFSAATEAALAGTAERVVRHVAGDPSIPLSGAAHTLRAGRAELRHRTSMVLRADEPRDPDRWASRLARAGSRRALAGGRVAFLFSGQGNQYHRMGFDLYRSRSEAGRVFRDCLDQVAGLLPGAEADDFRAILYGDQEDARINRTDWSQLTLFATQYAIATVMGSFGVRPDVLVGHSIGELTAAALAQVWSLPDAVRLVRARGRAMRTQPPGIMIAVSAGADRVRDVIAGLDQVWLSLDNSTQRSVIGMAPEAFDAVIDRLEAADVRGSRLHTSHAFHTPMMTDAAIAFERVVAEVAAREPRIPIISNRSGRLAEPGELLDPAYWREHITGHVHFTESLHTLMSPGLLQGEPLFGIELGPGRSLSSFAAQEPTRSDDHLFVNLLRHPVEEVHDEEQLLGTLGTLWQAGLDLDWPARPGSRRVRLPGYLFDRQPLATPARTASAPEPDAAAERLPSGTGDDPVALVGEAFSQVLGYPRIEPDDDFFALGGDSLKATMLVAQLAPEVSGGVTVADIFAAPSPAALAARLASAGAFTRPGSPDGAPAASRPGGAGTAIVRAAEAPDYPVSPAQRRMYLAAQLDPGTLVYNMFSATRLDGRLDHDRVRAALLRLVARHEPLRTTFVRRDEELRQRIADDPPARPAAVDGLPLKFSRGTVDADGSALTRRIEEFVRPFDLESGPLFRMEIVEDERGGSLLLFDIHHIVADAVSVEVLTRDFSLLYDGDLPPLPVQYRDYACQLDDAAAQQELLESETRLLALLDDLPDAELLATDRPRHGRDAAAGRVTLRLGADRVEQVARLAERQGATPFMVVLAAWGAVLGRYAGRGDLVIGAPVTGRTRTETGEMIGMFVNMMPIRLRPEPGLSVAGYLSASRQSVLDTLAHQDLPFDRLVDRLGLPRRVNRHPLFDVCVDYHNITHHDLGIDGVRAEPLALPPLAVGMDLVITCVESGDGLDVDIDYASGLFERTTIERLAHHFEVFLATIGGADPSWAETTPVGQVSIHDADDRAAVVARLTAAPFVPIHRRIEERARTMPDAVAVVDASGRCFSYAQLDGMANAQAARLRDAGLRRGERVALFSVREVSLLVAQLGIVKAGGAYVTLDPAHPRRRRERILADVRPRFGFAPPGLATAATIPTVFDLDSCTSESRPEFAGPDPDPDDIVYEIYTSGSTGTPKGIAVKHRGVANLHRDHERRGIFRPGDAIVALADVTFDIFLFESLLPLAAGATVQLCADADRKDAAAIARTVTEHGVSHIQAPVSKMAALVGNRRFRAALPRLRVIVCGGEHFSESLLQTLLAESGARVFNMYGPTETTVTATVKEFAPGDAVTVGTPILGADVLIAGEDGTLQPDGVPGELYILGEGVCAGYTNNPEQNRRAFTELRELPGVPAYRTGDAGLRLADGEIVLRGRLDHQVKLGGNRIELGEIEQVAMRVPGVAYAVADVVGDDLVLVCSAGDGADHAAAVRSEIAAALPGCMLPARIVFLAELPTLPNGKIDRPAVRSLAEAGTGPEAGAGTGAGAGTRTGSAGAAAVRGGAPASPGDTEGVILRAWEAVLGHPAGRDDNFFDAGGNSYKLMLVNNRLGELLGRDIPLVTLFEHPTPRALAEALGPAASDAEPEAPVPAADPAATADPAGFQDWAPPQPTSDARDRRIAVIGMAAVFPGAATPAEYLRNRFDGVVSVSRFSPEQLRGSGVDQAMIEHPRYVNARGFVAADTFDAGFFGYSAREAETMDPQLRLLHETTWHALEDAGYVPAGYPGRIALFAGSGTNFVWMAGMLHRGADPVGAFEAMTANEKDFLATKVAYKLDLTGPAVTVQTACSTSLVAVHEAVQCLRRGEAEMALAGGVALNFPRREGYLWHDGMIFSRDGTCRPFSGDADGTVAGQGCGVVLLKPLDRAVADGDHVYAVIAGSAVNNDGNHKVGYTAPSVRGQEQVIRAAIADAGIDAAAVGYVETHGTGTTLGDSIEAAALTGVYGRSGGRVALGAAKANIGHLDAAAGVAGFIAAVGVLDAGEIPPMANFSEPGANLEPGGALYVPTRRCRPEGGLRAAAVSSFGIGGTNAHVILEPAPRSPAERSVAGAADLTEVLLPLSARDEDALAAMQDAVAACCAGATADRLRDIAYTLANGRAEFGVRAVGIAVPDAGVRWLAADQAVRAIEEMLDAPGPGSRPAEAGSDTDRVAAPRPEQPADKIEATLRRRVLAAQWLRGWSIDRSRLVDPGRRVPVPGYAFAGERFTSDVALSDLGTPAPSGSPDRPGPDADRPAGPGEPQRPDAGPAGDPAA